MNRTTLPTLAAVAALAGCSHDTTAVAQPAAPIANESSTPDEADDEREPVAALADGHVSRTELDEATDDLQQSMTRLAGLAIVDVGALIDTVPEGAMNCYGPCEDDPSAQAWMQEQVTKIDRFHALVDTTEELVRTQKVDAREAVDALAALQLVELTVKSK